MSPDFRPNGSHAVWGRDGCARPAVASDFLPAVADHAEINDLLQHLADTPFEREGRAARLVRVVLPGVGFVAAHRGDSPGLGFLQIPSHPAGQHRRPVAKANARGGWINRQLNVADDVESGKTGRSQTTALKMLL